MYPASGAKIDNATVLIRDGRIAAVGTNVAVPAGATRIDAAGKWVTPGLIDAAGQMGLTEISAVPGTNEAFQRTSEVAASFNVAEGRCETCQGEGFVSVELLFLPGTYATCPACNGAGVVYTVLRNINKQIGGGATGIEFKDPTGLVLDGGLEFPLGHKWSLLADARYVPMETSSHVNFPGTTSSLDMHVRPLIVSFGAAYKP